MFDRFKAGFERVSTIIRQGAGSVMSERETWEAMLKEWLDSSRRKDMVTGARYHEGRHDILEHNRTAIGTGGATVKIDNLPNSRIVDNQYRRMVEQKVDYLIGNPVAVSTEDKAYEDALSHIFDARFHSLLKSVATDSLNTGIGWLMPFYDDKSKLCFRAFEPWEVLPLWSDARHTHLEAALRVYDVIEYQGTMPTSRQKVEVYKPDGVEFYELRNGSLIEDVTRERRAPYIVYEDEAGVTGYNWESVPLIAFKFHRDEIPLIKRVKSLQDGINIILSNFENNMLEDPRNTILVVVNYDGENLGEFRHNLATYGAVKVKSTDGAHGDVRTLSVEVNAENYKAILSLFKSALIENAAGFDAKDDRLAGNPNQMNILSMYSDIDLDANAMEVEFQAALTDLLEFIDAHLANTGAGDFSASEAVFTFSRDILMNEGEAIANCAASEGVVSKRTILAHHPWVSDIDAEIKALDDEQEEAAKQAEQFFGQAAATDTGKALDKDDDPDGKE